LEPLALFMMAKKVRFGSMLLKNDFGALKIVVP